MSGEHASLSQLRPLLYQRFDVGTVAEGAYLIEEEQANRKCAKE